MRVLERPLEEVGAGEWVLVESLGASVAVALFVGREGARPRVRVEGSPVDLSVHPSSYRGVVEFDPDYDEWARGRAMSQWPSEEGENLFLSVRRHLFRREGRPLSHQVALSVLEDEPMSPLALFDLMEETGRLEGALQEAHARYRAVVEKAVAWAAASGKWRMWGGDGARDLYEAVRRAEGWPEPEPLPVSGSFLRGPFGSFGGSGVFLPTLNLDFEGGGAP